ncbi:FAD/NAD(P)-binding protein [Geotalea toluenoxydans]|uniref:FAD/NAD(P)-binding protein n=1 Tax=Geotalea toluenoxydans TaxID=421624 RepID=UPI000A3DE30D|nr:FAD/NAD(P)-binding protein [Geotalea toluenoxydans]
MTGNPIIHIPAPAKIIGLKSLTSDIKLFRLRFVNNETGRGFRFIPGQFLQVSATGVGEAPFSPVSGPGSDGLLELCIRQAGHVTSKLHTLQEGDLVYVRGPFGNGFPVHEMKGHNLYLLAGGLGIVPLHSLLRYLVERRESFGAITFMYGAKEPSALLLREDLQEVSCEKNVKLMLTVDFATEDEAGKLLCNIGLLPDLLRGTSIIAEKSYAAVCGPPAFIDALSASLSRWALETNASCSAWREE